MWHSRPNRENHYNIELAKNKKRECKTETK